MHTAWQHLQGAFTTIIGLKKGEKSVKNVFRAQKLISDQI